MPVAPATICRTKRSWPGTSTTPMERPDGRSRRAKPSSMVTPRSFSSGRRSGSVPVSALTSADLPWSMWPAVPRTSEDMTGDPYSPVEMRPSLPMTSASSASVSVRGSRTTRSVV